MANESNAKANKENGQTVEEEGVELVVELAEPNDLQTRFANHMIVTRGPYESFITFYEIQPPTILGSPEEKEKQKKALKSIQGKAVARVVVPNQVVPSIIRALEENEEKAKQRAPRRASEAK
jgi:hypothetical protein